ncbi:MAG TPA: hypothetical protein VKD90_17220 [Gemmataceae bacterium]|nr:hypothetical protein [Gemmataceae bacterium]
MRIVFPILALAVLALAGCGPMGSGPMPPRLQDDEQKQVDESWDKALTPVDKLDRQSVLDALVLSQAYQAGVDKLLFRSEKKCAAGTVIMEIHFDRSKPDQDRFDFRVVAADGRVVRELTYNRQEVETTYKELHDPKFDPDRQPPQPLQGNEVQKRAEVKMRVEAVIQLFPKRDGEEAAKK